MVPMRLPWSQRPRPNEVFTPGSLPLEKSNVYARRRRPEDELKKYVDRDQVPVVFGEYGVGKTTLVRRYFLENTALGSVIYLPSAIGLILQRRL